jgi:hypothetical protein
MLLRAGGFIRRPCPLTPARRKACIRQHQDSSLAHKCNTCTARSDILSQLTTFPYVPDDYISRPFEIYHWEDRVFRFIFPLFFMFCRQQRIALQEALSLFHRSRQLLPSHNFYRRLCNKTQQQASNQLTSKPMTRTTH